MSGMDEAREKMPKGFGRSPRRSRFRGAVSGIGFALQRLCTWLGRKVTAGVVTVAFESRGSLISDWARVG